MNTDNLNPPEGFSYIDSIDPTIQQQLRYCSNENFIGTIIDGYVKSKAIMSTKAAIDLSKVQHDVLLDGFSLVIYDSYRPQKAVNHFIHWSKDATDCKNKVLYYPTIDKKDVFNLGYIAARSGHSRGSTVDLTIIRTCDILQSPVLSVRTLADGSPVSFLDDNTVDMGSSFDLLDELSSHACTRISAQQSANRAYLREKMEKFGFVSEPSEWWHYTLRNEPFPDTYFDFDVQ